MGFVPLIIDGPAEYSRRDGNVRSVLSLPLGDGSVLEHILRSTAELKPSEVLVLSTPDSPGCDPDAPGRPANVRWMQPGQMDQYIEDMDSSDCFVVVDTRSWPATWPTARDLQEAGKEYRGATHAIAVGYRLDRAIERIDCDEDGQIRTIHRLYATANWPEVAGDSVAWSLVPVRCMYGVRFTSSASLRKGLAARGVLSRDKPIATTVIDLTLPNGYLSFCERVLVTGTGRTNGPNGEPPTGNNIGRNCRIAVSARLVPPVIVGDGAVIDRNATIVGPALIGPKGRVRADATIAQSVVLGGVVVPEGATVRQQVYGGNLLPTPVAEDRSCGSAARPEWTPEWSIVPTATRPEFSHRRRRAHHVAKRTLDIVASATALLVLSPMLLLVSLLIKLDSRGPALFGHWRERKGGKEFRCWKFRTMVPDADNRQRELFEKNQVDGPQFKLDNDPRVTRVGRWLRATNLDELPQLINVLLGEMSLVGPRPSPFRENQICVAWRQARLSVRPGITGLWQICRAPDRSQGDFHEWIYYDIAYVRNFSFWLDIKILLATVATLGGHRRVPLSWLITAGETYKRKPVR